MLFSVWIGGPPLPLPLLHGQDDGEKDQRERNQDTKTNAQLSDKTSMTMCASYRNRYKIWLNSILVFTLEDGKIGLLVVCDEVANRNQFPDPSTATPWTTYLSCRKTRPSVY